MLAKNEHGGDLGRRSRGASARMQKSTCLVAFVICACQTMTLAFQATRRRHTTLSASATVSGWINTKDLLQHSRRQTGNETSIATIDGDDADAVVRFPGQSSVVEKLVIRDRLCYVKRDDNLHLQGSNISGNKARKFLSLNNLPADEFPDALVSYGGHQSNAMVALAAIVSSKNAALVDRVGPTDRRKRFIYYTKPIPRYLRTNPNGNFLRATSLGMEIQTLPHEEYRRLFGGLHGGSAMAPADLDPPLAGRSLWVPQGGASGVAQDGADVLALEIVDFWASKNMPRLAVCCPGGTCTTALLLSQSIKRILRDRRIQSADNIKVVVVPCVGDDEYALRQMVSLDKSLEGRGEDMPAILKPRVDAQSRGGRKGYFTFGEPKKEILKTFDELNSAGLFLDLLYGAPAWTLMLQNWRSRDDHCPLTGRQVLYIHSGGLEGISSQMTRYKHNNLIDERTIQ